MKSVKIKSFYVISGSDKTGLRQWIAIDAHSGGYLYWSDDVLSAKHFDTLKQVMAYKVDDYLLRDASDVCVMQITLNAEPVSKLPYTDLRKAEVEKEILKIKDQLAQKEQELANLK